MSDPTGRAVSRQELSAWLQSTDVNDGDEEASPKPTQRLCSEPSRKWPRRRSSLDDNTPGPRFGIDHATALLTDQSPASQGNGSIRGLARNTVDGLVSCLGASSASSQGQQGVGQDVHMRSDTIDSTDTEPMDGSFHQGKSGLISSPLFQQADMSDPTLLFQGAKKSLPFQDMQLSPRQQFPSRSVRLPGNCETPYSPRLHKAHDSIPLKHSNSMPTCGFNKRCTIGQGGDYRPSPRVARTMHLLGAMERSQRSQDHDAHTRRSFDLMSKTSRTRALLLDVLGNGSGGASSPAVMIVPRRARSPAIQAHKDPITQAHKAFSKRASIDSIRSWRKQEMRNAMLRNLMAEHIEEEKEKDLISKFERHLSKMGGLTGRWRPSSKANYSTPALKTGCWNPALEVDCSTGFRQQSQVRRLSAEYDVRGMDQERAVQTELERIKWSIRSRDTEKLRKSGDGRFQHFRRQHQKDERG